MILRWADPTSWSFSSMVVPEQRGLYRKGDRVLEDEIADIEDFFLPIARALVPVLAEYTGTR
jgi:hypothetical protein